MNNSMYQSLLERLNEQKKELELLKRRVELLEQRNAILGPIGYLVNPTALCDDASAHVILKGLIT